jgi:DNA polymerase-3 subunit gamma/tau
MQPVSGKKVEDPKKTKAKMGSLEKIREQVSIKNQNNGNDIKPLTAALLATAWNSFIETLAVKKNHSAVTNFKMATLEVIDENSFDIITQSNMHQKFIEAERSGLIHFMQQYFNNRLLKYQLILVENETTIEPGDKPLNTKQQYQLLAEEYPLIKELKDRLKLELDY